MFWKMNPAKLERYEPYLVEQLKVKNDEMKVWGWINGLYVKCAIAACLPGGGKYPETPMEIWLNENVSENDSEPITDADRFAAWASTFNKNKFG